MHPADAAELGLATASAVHVTSRRGRTSSTARLDATLSAGVVFLPIHWNELWAGRARRTSDDGRPRPGQQGAGAQVLRGRRDGSALI
jgi:anaerobic selenocysteine-containing dehydrogenase